MLSKKILVRLILLIIVTLAFLSTFYFFFKNSKAAGSPLNDKEYMEQIATLSKRYRIVSPPVPTPTASVIKEDQNLVEKISLSVLDFLTNLIK